MASRRGLSLENIESLLGESDNYSESSTENENSTSESNIGDDTSDTSDDDDKIDKLIKNSRTINNMFNVHNQSANENNLQTIDNSLNNSSSNECYGNSDSDINPTDSKRNKSSIFSNNISTKNRYDMYDMQMISNSMTAINQSEENGGIDRFNGPSHSKKSKPNQTRTRDRPPNEIDRFNRNMDSDSDENNHLPSHSTWDQNMSESNETSNSDDSVSNEPTQHPPNESRKTKPQKRKNRRKEISNNTVAYESDESSSNQPIAPRRKAGRPKGSKNKVNTRQRNQNIENESSPTQRRVTRLQTNPQPATFSDSDPENDNIHIGDHLTEEQRLDNLKKFWIWKITKPIGISLDQFDFNPPIRPGPNPEVFRDVEPKEINIFELYQTPDILGNILHYTNLHGEERHSKSKNKAKGNWNPLEISDLRCADAVLAYMGIVHLPEMSDYWSNDTFFGTAYMRHLMTRDKFYQTLRSLHFTDEKQLPENGDKLYKVRNLFKWYGEVYRRNYYPDRNLTVDESLAKYYGHKASFKVNIPRKAAKQGIKQYRLCESSTGYCMEFVTYSNSVDVWKNHELPYYDIRHFTEPAKIVIYLADNYLGVGHTMGTDAFFTDPRMARFFVENKTDIIGCMGNRKYVPKAMKQGNMGKWLKDVGQTKAWYKQILPNKGLMCLAWKDKKDVKLISSYHDGSMIETNSSRNPTEAHLRPHVVHDYKNVMPGVDRMDQYMATYNIKRTRMKRTYRIIYMVQLEMTYFNSYIVFRCLIKKIYENEYENDVRIHGPEEAEKRKKKKRLPTYLSYKKNVIKQTIEKYGKKNPRLNTSLLPVDVDEETRYDLSLGHWPEPNENRGTEKGIKRKREEPCLQCTTKEKKLKSSYHCSICKSSLHIINCFRAYHTKESHMHVSFNSN